MATNVMAPSLVVSQPTNLVLVAEPPRTQGVIPLGTDSMSFQTETFKIPARHFSASRVGPFIKEGCDLQSSRRTRTPYTFQHDFKSLQRLSLPALADVPEQSI